MGDCRLCGKPAGFLSKVHKECENRQSRGPLALAEAISNAIVNPGSQDDLMTKIRKIEKEHFVPHIDRKKHLAAGWEKAVERFLEDGVIDESEETRLISFKDKFALTQEDLNGNDAYLRVVKAAVLRNIMNGVIPDMVDVRGAPGINYQKNERIVWAFPGTRYYEEKSKRHFVGGSSGVSVRIMRGVYYRVGAFKGAPVTTTERTLIDTGWLILTDANIYFSGPSKSFRVPYAKIISYQPYSDGIGIMKDAATAKPQTFSTGDGWFAYNLVMNLSKS